MFAWIYMFHVYLWTAVCFPRNVYIYFCLFPPDKERRGGRRKERWEEEMEGGRKKEKEGHWSSILRANLDYFKISIKTPVVFDQRWQIRVSKTIHAQRKFQRVAVTLGSVSTNWRRCWPKQECEIADYLTDKKTVDSRTEVREAPSGPRHGWTDQFWTTELMNQDTVSGCGPRQASSGSSAHRYEDA